MRAASVASTGARAVTLQRQPGQNLGLSIVGRNSAPGKVHISAIAKGSVADLCGRLHPGDRILEVDGQDMRRILHGT